MWWMWWACTAPQEPVALPELPGGVWQGEVRVVSQDGLPVDVREPVAVRLEDEWRVEGQRFVQQEPEGSAEWVGVFEETSFFADYSDRIQITWRLEGDPDSGALSGTYEKREVFEPSGEGVTTESVREGTVALVALEAHDSGGDGLDAVGELGTSGAYDRAVNVRVRGDVAALANYEGGFALADVADPTAPWWMGSAPVEEALEVYNDVKWVDDTHVALASSTRGLVIVDVSDSSDLSTVAVWPSEGFSSYDVHTLAIEGDLAFLSRLSRRVQGVESPGGLDIVNIADPTAPFLVGSWEVSEVGGTLVHDLFVFEERAYLCSWEAGLVVLDVSSPPTPSLLGVYDAHSPLTSHSVWVFPQGDRVLALHGDEGFGAHLRILDVTDPSEIAVLSEWQTRPEVSIHNVMVAGNQAVVAYYQDGVRMLDIGDPGVPAEVARFNSFDFEAETAGERFFDGAVGIDVANDRIYLADSRRGLLILEE